MRTGLRLNLAYFAALAIFLSANPGSTLAGGGSNSGVPVHGPGSSHNPIVYHPVHGPGSSHNPIVTKSGGNALPVGTVVRDHRNGKNCQYTVGDAASILRYNICEGHGGHG